MKKYILIALLFVAQFAYADCPQFYPLGKVVAVPNSVELCNNFYAIQYDTALNAPIYSAEKFIQGSHSAKRANDFHPDERLSKETRAENSDYVNERTPDGKDKYDRGHLTPAADAICEDGLDAHECLLRMESSFDLANMSPQAGTLNEQSWRLLEMHVRVLKPEYVVTGAIYSANPKTIGAHHVPVPDSYYKIIWLNGKTQAWVAENKPHAPVVESTIEAVEADSGLKFPRYEGVQ